MKQAAMSQAATARPAPLPKKVAPPRRVSIVALLLSVLLLTVGTNLQGVLLPIRRHLEGSGMQAIGLLSAGWSAGFVIACFVIGRVVSAVGHVRVFAALAALNAAASLLFLPLNSDAFWVLLRVVIGFSFGGLVIIIESWLNEQAGEGRRGAVFAAYMTISLIASLAGTLSLAVLDPIDPLAFTLMILAVVLSILPVALTRSPQPQPIEPFSIHLGALYRLSPTGIVGCFAVGLSSGALGGLLSVYGLAIGLNAVGVAHLLSAALLGGALAYYPIGALSDRLDRRVVILILAFASAGLCAILVLPAALPKGSVIVLVGALGFLQYPLYGLCVAMTNDRVREQSFSEVASEVLIVYGVGTVIGPLAAAWLMHRGADRLFVFAGAVLAGQGVFTTVRLIRRSAALREPGRRSHPLEIAPNSARVIQPRD